MIKVEITESNIPFFVENELEEFLDYFKFQEISQLMDENEYLSFHLIDEKGIAIYKGTFEKKSGQEGYTVTDDIFLVLQGLVDKKVISKRRKNQMMKLINASLNEVEAEPKMNVSVGKSTKKEKSKRERNWSFPKIKLSKKIILIWVCICSALLLVTTYFVLAPTFESKNQSKEEPTLAYYLKKKDYLKAAEKFPSEIYEIEKTLVKNKDFDQLESFEKKYPTVVGAFDLAFYKKEWDKVVKSDIDSLNFERKVMLTHAFIMLDWLEDAEIFNKRIKSKELSLEIERGYFNRAVNLLQTGKVELAKDIQKKIQNEELQTLIEDAELYNEMISFNKEDKDKQNHWKRKLENIGKDIIEDGK